MVGQLDAANAGAITERDDPDGRRVESSVRVVRSSRTHGES